MTPTSPVAQKLILFLNRWELTVFCYLFCLFLFLIRAAGRCVLLSVLQAHKETLRERLIRCTLVGEGESG